MEHSKLDSEFQASEAPPEKKNKDLIISFAVLISSAWAFPIIPNILGLDGWEIISWVLGALFLFGSGLLLLLISGITRLFKKNTTPSPNTAATPPAPIIISESITASSVLQTRPNAVTNAKSGMRQMRNYAALTTFMLVFSLFLPQLYSGADDDSTPNQVIYGCTFADASNYNPAANYPDWSCEYEHETDPCDLVWPDDPFHAAIYSFISEYALNYGGAVGCYGDHYQDLSYESVAYDLEDHWEDSESAFNGNASSYAQEWLDSNADEYGKDSFDVYEVFQIAEGGLGMNGGHGSPECTEGTHSESTSNASMFTIEENPNIAQPAFQCFTKFVEVFGLGVFAESGLSDDQVIHAATVLAELLDNDEDGVVDDSALHERLLEANATVPMFNAEGSPAEYYLMNHYQGEGIGAVLYADEVDPSRTGRWGYDDSVEEIMHTINMVGHVYIYPDAFGIEPNSSLLSEAMDESRGGQFLETPSSYPEDAWYHYDDITCEYDCMAGEYIYWAQVTNMGILNDTETCDGIADEWEPCSKEMLESMDVLIYDLVTDPQYKLPQIAPDGVYSPESD
jgi:hypothetical protein